MVPNTALPLARPSGQRLGWPLGASRLLRPQIVGNKGYLQTGKGLPDKVLLDDVAEGEVANNAERSVVSILAV